VINEKFIFSLIDKFNATSIAELDLNDGTSHLVLRKESAFLQNKTPAMPLSFSGASEKNSGFAEKNQSSGIQVHQGVTHSTSVSTPEGEIITSPLVAAFYASPGPDAPTFVRPGSKVKAGETLCILEAMKMMNQLEAEFDCEIIKTHASTGELVEYGQTLFTVKRL